MADRRGGPPRGRGGPRGNNDRGGRGGGGRGRGGREHDSRSNQTGGAGDKAAPEKKRENILDLSKYMDKEIRVRFNGGREVRGFLKGYDQLMNLVLDDVKEMTQGEYFAALAGQGRFVALLSARWVFQMLFTDCCR